MITKQDVEHVAKLARLKLTESEKEKFVNQLGQILGYVEKLDQLDTKDIIPTAHALPLKNVWREDKMVSCPDKDLILNNAPEKEANYFKVKKVIE